MSEKKLNILVAVGLLGVDGYYLYKSFTARTYKMVFIGPYEFPKLVGIVLAVLCCIVLVQNLWLKHETDQALTISNIPLIFFTGAATCIFVFLWQKIGWFYPLGTIYLLLLLFAYRTEEGRFSRKNIVTNLVLTMVLMLCLYLLFKRLMGINL